MRARVRESFVRSGGVLTLTVGLFATLVLGCGARTGLPDCQDPKNGFCPTEPGAGLPDAGMDASGSDAGTDANTNAIIPNNIATAATCRCTCTQASGIVIDGGVPFGPTNLAVCLPQALNYTLGGPNISLADFVAGDGSACPIATCIARFSSVPAM